MVYTKKLKYHISLISVLVLIYFLISPLESVLSFSMGTISKYISFVVSTILIFELLLFKNKITFDVLLKTALCLILLSWLSVIWSINPNITISRNIAYTLLPLFFMVVYILKFNERLYYWLDHALIIGGLVAVTYLLMMEGFSIVIESRLNISGNDPNNFSAQLFLPLIIAFKHLAEARRFFLKLAYGFAFSILTAVFFLTGSRGGLISLASVAIIYSSYLLKHRNVLTSILLIVSVFIIIFFLIEMLPEHIVNRVFALESYAREVSPTGRRLNIWTTVFKDILPSLPLWGVGSGVAPIKVSLTDWFYGYRIGIHNTYLNLLIEYGLFGLPLFLYFVTSIFKKVLTQKDVYKICILVGILIIIFFLDSYAKKFLWNSLMYCSLGLYRVNTIKNKKK
jgi:O-antigen ligase